MKFPTVGEICGKFKLITIGENKYYKLEKIYYLRQKETPLEQKKDDDSENEI